MPLSSLYRKEVASTVRNRFDFGSISFEVEYLKLRDLPL
jgi:hypothetical protein